MAQPPVAVAELWTLGHFTFMPELEAAIKEIESTVAILRRSSCERWVARLEQLLADLRVGNDFTQKQALFQIGELCHPKALGDVRITAVDFQTWDAQLEALHDICARAFNILERRVA
jgi:hypothetical protein